MKSLLAFTLVILVIVGATKEARSSVDDEEAVAALDTEYQAAVKNNDVATIDRILADDFVLVTGLGKTYSKRDLLQEARSKRMHYERQEDSQQKVRVWGDTAVVTALLWAKGTLHGKAFDYKLWFSDIYLKTEKGWRYVFAQASTRIPDRDFLFARASATRETPFENLLIRSAFQRPIDKFVVIGSEKSRATRVEHRWVVVHADKIICGQFPSRF